MYLGAATLFVLLCSLTNAGIFGGNTYTVEEQQTTHFEAALTAYHRNDVDKAIRIFEYLQREIKPSSIKHPFVVWNLALLYHDKEQFSKAIQWAEITSKYEITSFVGGFLLACLLFFKGKTEHYNSFMAFRSIKITNKSILPDMQIEDPSEGETLGRTVESIVDYNIAVILYKMGAVAAADTHVDEVMNKIRNVPTKFQLFKKVKAMKGIDHAIDTSPISDFRLLTISGEIDVKRTEPLHPQRKPKKQEREDATLDHDSDHILAYYFENAPSASSTSRHVSPRPLIPSPHQLSNHYDHHMDYFSHKAPSSKVASPNLMPPPPPKMPRPTLNRGFTAPPSHFGARKPDMPSSR
jgi:hypothetical protein